MARVLVRIPDAPIGTIQAFAGTAIPAGWLICDGASLNTENYSLLFNKIGTRHGTTSITTFNLPDLRGRFLRGTASGSTSDPNRNDRIPAAAGGAAGDSVGSLQGSAFTTHNHGGGVHAHDIAIRDRALNPLSSYFGFAGGEIAPRDSTGYQADADLRKYLNRTGTPNVQVVNTEGSGDTRPINISVNYIIKYI